MRIGLASLALLGLLGCGSTTLVSNPAGVNGDTATSGVRGTADAGAHDDGGTRGGVARDGGAAPGKVARGRDAGRIEDAGGACNGEVDSCGVCNGHDRNRDCAGTCFGSSRADCRGACGGKAVLDDCGVCDGRNASMDCAGVCNGAALPDCAGDCNGRAVRDCKGVCNGTAARDCANVCGGSAVRDCQGVCRGAAVVDCAGVCAGSAVLDCEGVCNGPAVTDCRGVCRGSAHEDCAGVCNGSGALDCAGVCNGGAVRDCQGTCNGTAQVDCNGTCNGTSVRDCAGTCNGAAIRDCKGTCNGIATRDCQGVCNGPALVDCTGTCNGTATRDCAGTCNGTATHDCAGTCNGAAFTDCTGACGYAVVDDCGVCGGHNAAKDCDGVCFGTHLMDCSWWPTLQHDNQRTGYNPNEAGVPPLALHWSKSVFQGALNPVAIQDYRVIATSTNYFGNNTVYALDAGNGEIVWSYDIGDAMSIGQPSMANGRVFIQQNKGTSNNTNLWAFDGSTGQIAWRAPYGSQWENFWAPLVTGDGVFIDGGEYGGLFGFSVTDGSQLWFNGSLEQYDEWSPAAYNGLIYSFVAGNLRGHAPATGEVSKTISVTWNWAGWSMYTTPAFSGGLAAVIAPPSLYVLNLTDSATIWSGNNAFSGVPSIVNDVVLAISGGALVARRLQTGELLWTFVGDGALNHPAVSAAGYVYVSSGTNTYAVALDSGLQAWTVDRGGWLSLAAGHLYIASSDGSVAAYQLTMH